MYVICRRYSFIMQILFFPSPVVLGHRRLGLASGRGDPACNVINNVVLVLWRKHVATYIIIIEGMKHRRNRRLANFTKSAVTIGILLPKVPLHYCCLPYTSVVPFLALTLQRSAFIRNTDRPKLGFLTFFRNWTNQSATKTTQMSHVFCICSRMARRNTNTLPAVDAESSPTLSTLVWRQ